VTGIAGRQVIGVQVAGNDLRLHPEQALEVGNALLVRGERFVVLQVADVVAEEGVLAARQAEGILELGSGSQQGRQGEGQAERVGGVAARPADRIQTASCQAGDRVVHPHVDRPVVQQEGICQAGQTLAGLLVAIGDGLFAQVSAGHDQQFGETLLWLEQQQMQRSVGQHDAQRTLPGSHTTGHARLWSAVEQQDRPLAGAEQLGFLW
jgi:hypothetical protein